MQNDKPKQKKRKKGKDKNKKLAEKSEEGGDEDVPCKKKKTIKMNGHNAVGALTEDAESVKWNGVQNPPESEIIDSSATENETKLKKKKKKIKKNNKTSADTEVVATDDGDNETNSPLDESMDSVRQTLNFHENVEEDDSSLVSQEKKTGKINKRKIALSNKTKETDDQDLSQRKTKPKARKSVREYDGEKSENPHNSGNELPTLSKKKKRKRLNDEDQPTPVVQFLNTPPPKAFARRKQTTLKTEPKPVKSKTMQQVRK